MLSVVVGYDIFVPKVYILPRWHLLLQTRNAIYML